MAYKMRRLIDDERRRSAISFLLAVASGVVIVGCGWLKLSALNEEWRSEGLALTRELHEQLTWLNSEMDISRDVQNIAMGLEALSVEQKSKDDIAQSDVDFILETRKHDCLEMAKAAAQKCKSSIIEQSKLRRRLFVLITDGTNIWSHLKELKESESMKDVETVRLKVVDQCRELQKICGQKIVISRKFKPELARFREFADYVARKKVDDSDWMKIKDAHFLCVNWTNDVTQTLNGYNEIVATTYLNYQTLKRFLFNREQMLVLARKKIDDEIQRIESILSEGRRMCDCSVRYVNEMSNQHHAIAKRDYEALIDLHEKHGDFVDTATLASALQLLKTFDPLRKMAIATIKDHVVGIQAQIDNIVGGRKGVIDMLSTLHEKDNGVADERTIIELCDKGRTQVHDLCDARMKLEAGIIGLSNYVECVRSEFREKSEKIGMALENEKQALPDWVKESEAIKKDFEWLLRETLRIKSEALSQQSFLSTCRDKNVLGSMILLHERSERTLNAFKALEAECRGDLPCSNGKELMALRKCRDMAREIVRTERQNVIDLQSKVRDLLASGAIEEKRYRPYTHSFAAQLQKGVRQFNLALDIPSAGRHHLEIRLRKGRPSLYKVTPSRIHNVVVGCLIVGLIDKTDVRILPDWTKIESCNFSFEDDFAKGMNDFRLDLTFSAKQDQRGHPIQGGEWQFLFHGEDNCWIEFLLDGKEVKVFSEEQ